MTVFSDLPPELVIPILQAVEGWPGNKAIAAQLRTNRMFYEHLKPTLYAKPNEFLLHNPGDRFFNFRTAMRSDPKLPTLVKSWILPFTWNYTPSSHRRPQSRAHRWFTYLPGCTQLELAIHGKLRRPEREQIGNLKQITDLTLSSYIPEEPEYMLDHNRRIEDEDVEAWLKHMPRLTGFYVLHMACLPVTLLHLPNTLLRLELLGDSGLFFPYLSYILPRLSQLKHFVFSEPRDCNATKITHSFLELADVIRDKLSPSASSLGIGFVQQLQNFVSNHYLTPSVQREMALLLHRPFHSLTFLCVIDLAEFIDCLATSDNGRLVTALSFRANAVNSPVRYREDEDSASTSMFKLLDRAIFPNLAVLRGSRVKEELEEAGGWAAFAEKAGSMGVLLYDVE